MTTHHIPDEDSGPQHGSFDVLPTQVHGVPLPIQGGLFRREELMRRQAGEGDAPQRQMDEPVGTTQAGEHDTMPKQSY